MITATLICFPNALATSIIGIGDLLGFCGVTWNYINKEEREPKFKVQLAAQNLAPVKCVNGMRLDVHQTLDESLDSDIVIIPTIGGNIEKTLISNPEITAYLTKLDQNRTLIASNCTGAFFLAEAGLLNGQEATTHWGFAEEFRLRYPNVDLKPEKMLTRSGNVLCSAGGHACFDLGLYLIERFYGHEQAVQSSKSFVLDMGRKSQLSYSPVESSKHHNDELIKGIQYAIDEQYQDLLPLSELAKAHGISERSMIRRFKKATGDTPASYVQSVRLEHAKQLLENSQLKIADITHAVGYEDISSFTRLFKKHTGLTPGHYRERYASRFNFQ